MTAEAALLAIQDVLDGVEWTPDTLERIAAIMIEAGYRIRDRHDMEQTAEDLKE